MSVLTQSVGFILVGLAWGFTNPFIRRGSIKLRKNINDANLGSIVNTTMRQKFIYFLNFLKIIICTPSYLIPLGLNMTGSLWYFWLLRNAKLTIAVPVTNSIAFIFTVCGDWYLDRKSIRYESLLGIFLIAIGLAVCVQSKSQPLDSGN